MPPRPLLLQHNRLACWALGDHTGDASRGKAIDPAHLKECATLQFVVENVQTAILLRDAAQPAQQVGIGRFGALLPFVKGIDRGSDPNMVGIEAAYIMPSLLKVSSV